MSEKIPADWRRVRLLDVVQLPSGQVDPRFDPYASQVLIAPDHIESDTGRILRYEDARSQAAVSGKYQVLPDDILYSKIRPALRKVALSDFRGLCSADIYPLRPLEGVHPRFLLYVLLGSRFSLFAESVSGRSGIPKVNRVELAEFSFPLPPLREQIRMADSVEALDEAIRSTERLIAKLEHVHHGLAHDLLCQADFLRDQVTTGWITRRLDEFADIGGGVTLGQDLPVGGSVVLPYLRVANVQDGYIDTSDLKSVAVLKAEVDRYLLRPGDVLMTEGGDFDKLGRGAVWDGSVDPCLHQNHIFRVRCNPKALLPEYLAAYSRSVAGRRYFLNSSKQTTNLASINKRQLSAFPVPTPPMHEQRRIVDVLGRSTQRIASAQAELAKLRQLKVGLMDDLLTGRVRVSEVGDTIPA
jgi:type I restriction enzyme S subunit